MRAKTVAWRYSRRLGSRQAVASERACTRTHSLVDVERWMGIGRPRPLTAVQQLIGLQRSLICPGQGTVRLGRLTWDFEARPTVLSRVYGARVIYRQDATP